MSCVAFLLLAHKAPDMVAAQARMLVGRGDAVVIHFDAGAPHEDWLALVQALAGLRGVHLLRDRVRGGWGQWSLVQASLRLMDEALRRVPEATHFYLLSGDCMPTRPVAELRAHLDAAPCDYMESFDFFGSDWIKTGLKAERVIYHHPFNERSQPRLFHAALWVQQRLGLVRRLPDGLRFRIGSQWWCLRRETVKAVLSFCQTRRDVVRFFRTTWIPDETFFQTIVAHLVPADEISGRTLTRLMFSDYGLPVCFHTDQADMLMAQDGFFVRKLATGAAELRHVLRERFLAEPGAGGDMPEGPELMHGQSWMRARGRIGRLNPHPPWARPTPALTLIICKDWHLARLVARRSAAETGRVHLGHVFDEVAACDPDLGGFGRTLEARRSDPLAWLTRAAEVLTAGHLIVCIDPWNSALVQDLQRAGAVMVRLDEYQHRGVVEGHSRRIGLGETMLDAVAAELLAERAALDALGPDPSTIISATDPMAVRARRLARVLDIGEGLAIELAAELDPTGA